MRMNHLKGYGNWMDVFEIERNPLPQHGQKSIQMRTWPRSLFWTLRAQSTTWQSIRSETWRGLAEGSGRPLRDFGQTEAEVKQDLTAVEIQTNAKFTHSEENRAQTKTWAQIAADAPSPQKTNSGASLSTPATTYHGTQSR